MECRCAGRCRYIGTSRFGTMERARSAVAAVHCKTPSSEAVTVSRVRSGPFGIRLAFRLAIQNLNLRDRPAGLAATFIGLENGERPMVAMHRFRRFSFRAPPAIPRTDTQGERVRPQHSRQPAPASSVTRVDERYRAGEILLHAGLVKRLRALHVQRRRARPRWRRRLYGSRLVRWLTSLGRKRRKVGAS